MSTSTPLYGWDENEVAWVDYDENQLWSSFKKQEPWDFKELISNIESAGDSNNGSSLAISDDALNILSGAPNESNGVVYAYLRDTDGIYNPGSSLRPDTIGSSLTGYGTSIASGNVWMAAGAPDSDSSNGFVIISKRSSAGIYGAKQVLRIASPSGSPKFGYSLAMSKDDRYLFVSAPGANIVYCYAQKGEIIEADENNQTVVGTAGSETNFTLTWTPSSIYSLHIVDDNAKEYAPY
jgi:hypothetical protein